MEVRIAVSSSFTEAHACFSGPLTPDLTFLQHEKWNGSHKTLFLSLWKFAKHLRPGSHLLLSCKQATRTERERKSLASWPHPLAPVLRQAPAPEVGKTRTPGAWASILKADSLFSRTKNERQKDRQTDRKADRQKGRQKEKRSAGTRGGSAGYEMRYGLMSESLRFSDKWAVN